MFGDPAVRLATARLLEQAHARSFHVDRDGAVTCRVPRRHLPVAKVSLARALDAVRLKRMHTAALNRALDEASDRPAEADPRKTGQLAAGGASGAPVGVPAGTTR